MTLIKELIDIPDRVQKGDFVLRLAEEINRPEVVLENHVVTLELEKCFDSALSFIGSAASDSAGQSSDERDSRVGTSHPEAQRMAGWQEVPTGAGCSG